MSRFEILQARVCTAVTDWLDAAQERYYDDGSVEPGGLPYRRTSLRARLVGALLRRAGFRQRPAGRR